MNEHVHNDNISHSISHFFHLSSQGKYCNGSTVVPLECPAGHFCVEGTRAPYEHPCPPGYFNNKTGQIDKRSCEPCTPGMYCEGPGSVNPDGDCDEGFFCRMGSTSPRPGDMGQYNESVLDTSPCYRKYDCFCPGFNETAGTCAKLLVWKALVGEINGQKVEIIGLAVEIIKEISTEKGVCKPGFADFYNIFPISLIVSDQIN